jgi:hypothetical protein
MAAYPVLIAGGFVSMFMLVMWCHYRDQRPGFEMTEFVPRAA